MNGDQDIITAIKSESTREGDSIPASGVTCRGVEDEVNVIVCCPLGSILRLLRGADVDVPAGVSQCVGGQFSFFTITFEIIFHFYEENTRASAIKFSKFFRKPKGFFSDGFFGFRIECHGKLLI